MSRMDDIRPVPPFSQITKILVRSISKFFLSDIWFGRSNFQSSPWDVKRNISQNALKSGASHSPHSESAVHRITLTLTTFAGGKSMACRLTLQPGQQECLALV